MESTKSKFKLDSTGIVTTILGIILTASLGYLISVGDRLNKVEINLAVVQTSIDDTNISLLKVESKLDKITDYIIEKK
jgi:hypothetical protein